MIQKNIQKMMEEWNMVSPGDVLLAAVSGGADSVCLLLALVELQQFMQFSLEAIHVEHGIRGEESLEDQRFVQDLCASLGVPLTCVTVDVLGFGKDKGLSEEEAARILRYEQFSRVAMQKNAKVVLAHHMEDNAETILFQMIRGSRLTGMRGIQPVRKDEHGVMYLRPMLRVHREEIENMLAQRNQIYRTDSTNLEVDYSRNYLRREVLPKLVAVNEQAVSHMTDMAGYMWELNDFLEGETEKAWERMVRQHKANGTVCSIELEVESFHKLHSVVQKELLMKMMVQLAGSRKDITSGNVMDLLELCQKQSGKEVHLPYKMMGKRTFDKLVLAKEETLVEPVATATEVISVSPKELESLLLSGDVKEVVLGVPQECLRIRVLGYNKSAMEIPKKTYTKWLDYDKIKQGFSIRVRREGDYFISDSQGHRKKLQNYFVDEKIPVEERDKMWVLAQESYVLWLVGGRISENIKVTENTQVIVELEYIGGRENGFYKKA